MYAIMPTPRKISREATLAAALRIADVEGIEAVTMRRVASELGVEPMSLYKHISNKADVLDGISEAVMAEVEVPDRSTDPASAIRAIARSIRKVALAHPRVFPLIALRPVAGPTGLGLVEETVRILLSTGLDPAGALKLYRILDSYTIGSALFDVARMTRSVPLPDTRGYPLLASVAAAASSVSPDQAFEEGLDRLISASLPEARRDS